MSFAWRVAREALSGALLGAFFLGIGCRIVMRLLANLIDRAGEFSIGGSLEIAAYGAMVGALAGAAYALCRPVMPGRWQVQGLALAALTYASTIATLPAHIAETARPFADRMPTILSLFGLCFLLFGLAMARFSSRASNPVPEAAPAAPRE